MIARPRTSPWTGSHDVRELQLVAVLATVIMFVLLFMPLQTAILLAIVAAFAVLVMLDTWQTVVVLLVVRSSLDVVEGVQVYGGLNLAGLLSALLVLTGLAHVAIYRVDLKRTPLVRPLCVLLGVWAVGVVLSSNPGASLQDWLRGIGSFLLYVLMVDLVREGGDERRSMLVKAIIVSTLIPMSFGMFQFATGTGNVFTPGFDRIRGTFVHPSPYAFYLLSVAPFAYVLARHLRSGAGRVALNVLVPVMLFCVVVTFTRIAWAGLVVTILVFAYIRNRSLVLPIILAFAAIAVLVPPVADRLSNASATSGTGGWRVTQWSDVLGLMAAWQLPFGIGLGSVARLTGYAAHNDYVRILAETGVAGSIAFAVVYYKLIRGVLTALAGARTPLHRDLALAFLAVLVARLVMAFTDNIVDQPVLEWYFWSFAALIVSLPSFPGVRAQMPFVPTYHPSARPRTAAETPMATPGAMPARHAR
ncbi:MAG TPA: O-antigen ligase family protein [Dehalococcoidia bacterium]|nr:O-antigen ligase family protein [Dehalococcoidia bacterium]